MSAKVILWPKFYPLSTDPEYIDQIHTLANSFWEDAGKPEGSRESYYSLAGRGNPIVRGDATLLVNGEALFCSYEFRQLPSPLPCENCHQKDQSHQPEVRIYRVTETIYREDGSLKMASPRLWHPALREILRMHFVGGGPWCYRKKCRKEYQRLLDFRRDMAQKPRARRN